MCEEYFLTEKGAHMVEQQRNVFYQPPGIKELFYKENEILLKHVDKTKRVLDVGCGLGTHLIFLSKYAGEVVGIDHSDALLKRCVKNIEELKNAKALKMNARKMDFPDNYFDQACCMFNTLGNIADVKLVLSEMQRVVVPGGYVIFSLYNLQSFPERIEFYRKTGLDDAHVEGTTIRSGESFFSNTYTEEQIAQFCKEVGLDVVFHRTHIGYVCEATKVTKK
ncbi:MAG: class I SAM-dependent methyltransferase [Candidatus Micrarchaeota archaeon]